MMELDRRSFIQSAALVGGAGALASAASLVSTAGAQEGDQASDEARAAFEAAAEPIAPAEPPASWDEEYEIVVVGSGAAGVNASIRLAQAGYQVLMVERSVSCGGSSQYSSIFSNFGGHKQAEEAQWAYPSYPYDVDNIVEFMLDCQQMTGDPQLVRAMATEGPKCIDWMIEKAGAKWVPSNPTPAGTGLLEWEGMKTETNGINVNYYPLITLVEQAQADGVEVRTLCNVDTLVFDGEGVVGVKVSQEDGEELIHATRGVILCAGGMEVNRAMMAKYSATCLPGIASVATPPNGTGECIRMGQGVGADLAGYDSTGAFDGGVWWRDYGEYDLQLESHINKDGNQVVRQPWLRINKLGERVPYISTQGRSYPYTTEADPSSAALCDTAGIEMAQPGGKTYVIFDSKYEQLMLDNYFGQIICRKATIVAEDDPYIDRVPVDLRDWHTGFQQMIDAGAIKQCDSIEELEGALGLTEGILVGEVQKWNDACAAGEGLRPLVQVSARVAARHRRAAVLWLRRRRARVRLQVRSARDAHDAGGEHRGTRHPRAVRRLAYGGRLGGRRQRGGQAPDGHVCRPRSGVRGRLHGGWRHHRRGREVRGVGAWRPSRSTDSR